MEKLEENKKNDRTKNIKRNKTLFQYYRRRFKRRKNKMKIYKKGREDLNDIE